MKMKKLVLLVSGALLASCSLNQQSATQASIRDLKAAANAEASKTNVHYSIAGDVSFEGKEGEVTMRKALVQNLNADLNVVSLNGGILKAKTEDYRHALIYGTGSSGKIEYNAYRAANDCYASFSTPSANASAYLSGGNLYADLSAIDRSSAIWNNQTGAESPAKILMKGFVDCFSFAGVGFSGFEFSETDIETYILNLCTFSSSGNYTTANLKLDQDKIANAYVSINLAKWASDEMPQISKDMQDDAMIAVKKRLQQEIANIVPAFDLDLSVTYDSTGIYSANLDMNATISPDGANASVDADKKHVYAYDINLSVNSRNDANIPEFVPSEYIEVNY